jgi:hypothetical protein
MKLRYAFLLLLLQAARGLGRGKDFTFVTSDVAELVPVVKHMQQVCLYCHLSYCCTLLSNHIAYHKVLAAICTVCRSALLCTYTHSDRVQLLRILVFMIIIVGLRRGPAAAASSSCA